MKKEYFLYKTFYFNMYYYFLRKKEFQYYKTRLTLQKNIEAPIQTTLQ